MKDNKFISSTFILFIGTSIAQLLSFAASPILTRLYGPDAFGLMALFISVTSVVSVISCLRYECSILLPESDKAAANILAGSLLIALLNSLLILLLVYFGQHLFIKWLNAPSFEWYLWLLPFITLFDGAFNALNYWNTRTKSFFRLSIARVSNSVCSIAAQLCAGFSGYVTGGSLIGGIFFGKVLSTGVLGYQIWNEDQYILRGSVSRTNILIELKKYINFPLYDIWAELLNTISWQLPVFLLSAFFSSEVVGYYSLGLYSLQFPMRLIGGSIAQVFFQQASEAKKNGSLTTLVEQVFRALLLIGMFPILTLTFVGDHLFCLVFGEMWSEAGVYSQILSIWIFFWFISSPLSTLYYIFGKQQSFLKFTIVNFLARFIALFVGAYVGSARISIILFSLAGICTYGSLCLEVMHFSGIKWQKTLNMIMSSIIVFIPSGLVLFMLRAFMVDKLIIVGISALLCAIYYVYISRTNSHVLHYLKNMKLLEKLSKLRGN